MLICLRSISPNKSAFSGVKGTEPLPSGVPSKIPTLEVKSASLSEIAAV